MSLQHLSFHHSIFYNQPPGSWPLKPACEESRYVSSLIEQELCNVLNMDHISIYRIVSTDAYKKSTLYCMKEFEKISGDERRNVIEYFLKRIKFAILIQLDAKERWPHEIYEKIKFMIFDGVDLEDCDEVDDSEAFFRHRVMDVFYKVIHQQSRYLYSTSQRE